MRNKYADNLGTLISLEEIPLTRKVLSGQMEMSKTGGASIYPQNAPHKKRQRQENSCLCKCEILDR